MEILNCGPIILGRKVLVDPQLQQGECLTQHYLVA